MQSNDIYGDIAERTSGEIYIGVVGPVRTGKSTFISRFMEKLVIPGIGGKNKKQVATDELPQSAAGRTIMTTEPKFVPANAAELKFGKARAKVRLIDCVGYLAEGAVGHEEDGAPRMVKTPWSDELMPFEKAAELGTEKVISEHATIAVLITTDGSICEIPRADYVKPEERVVNELKALNKPFAVVLNCADSESDAAKDLANELSEKYSAPVLPLNVLKMTEEDITRVIEKVLMEFPVRRIDIELPEWMRVLSPSHPVIEEILKEVAENADKTAKMSDYAVLENAFSDNENVFPPCETTADLSTGGLKYKIEAKPDFFYRAISEECGEKIENELSLMSYVKGLKDAKAAYIKLKQALSDAQETGYGVVTPSVEEMKLNEPEVVKKNGRYGVRLKAEAPSLHIMKVDVEAEVSPSVASEQQGEELVNYLLSEFENNPNGIWQTNMFGKPLSSLVRESIAGKLDAMPVPARNKMRKTVTRIVNEGKGGVLCILI
ncbi:MAG: stage IV sporulation protein A [Christensenellaceae bacterium]|nr:stage IV sporulation protein A [Christensenellaceae bacterium]MDD6926469.1 stage IV sporulation protein A [bacterium]MDY2851327.1 stage IV sporulation protein A [Christensenellaceae bacterium]